MSQTPAIELNRDLREGEYVAFGENPSQHERLRIPHDPIPSWAKTIHVSPEDYGKILRMFRGRQ